ncbi:MAG: enoyl-CoA hydratase/isomerase family protein [Acidobacteria bacterium]|nr:enoyl-CoA hydratase/isomerase family protein [Acidobacteriota bacterium]MBI3471971.1 enoyl-CoA hydratase/isomerase family protein [Candidatus Solibacter usitatus]
MSENLRIERQGRVLRLVLDRPEKRNALNLALCRELVKQVEEAWRDHGVGAILLAGEGKSFCAGMDLTEMLSPEAAGLTHIHELLFTIGVRSSKPIVAAVQGAALAGGTGLAANAHILVAAEDATFGLTEIRLGLWPFVVFRAVALAVGERRAVELSLTGRTFDAREAAQLGLVDCLVPPADLDARALEIATAVAAASPSAVRGGLAYLAESRGRSSEETGRIAYQYRAELFRSPDFAEGLRAFHEKRAPRWPSLEE